MDGEAIDDDQIDSEVGINDELDADQDDKLFCDSDEVIDQRGGENGGVDGETNEPSEFSEFYNLYFS